MVQKILGKVSVCEYTHLTCELLVRGWFLYPENITKIEIIGDKEHELGIAQIGIRRPDIAQKYPEFNNYNSGWEFSCHSYNSDISSIALNVYLGDKIIHTFEPDISFNDYSVLYGVLESSSSFRGVLDNNAVTPPKTYTPNVINQLREHSINVDHVVVDFDEFYSWFERVDYPKNYPKYANEFKQGRPLYTKAFQHYFSYKLLSIKRDDIYIDVASSNSVFPNILRDFYSVENVYIQDQNYPKGLNGNVIGSNASSIPFKSNSVDAIALHCSIEHFEGDDDFLFLRESCRLLKPGGELCIIPLYMSEKYFLYTSPSCWSRKYKNTLDTMPVFDKRAEIYVWEKIKQSQRP